MYTLPEQTLLHHTGYDVIVVGGGPAGCAAAAAAAREGVRTLLIESTFVLGGMGTAGLVPAWCPFSDKEKILYRGIAEEVFTAAKAEMSAVGRDDLDWVPIDAEALKRVYDRLVFGSGAEVLFGTTLCGADCADGKIRALIAANKGGLAAYSAKIYIDCTGDGDLAAAAGARFHMGAEDGTLMPATHCFTLAGVKMEAFLRDPKNGRDTTGGLHPNNKSSITYALAKDGRYPHITDEHLCNSYLGADVVGFNAGHLWDVDNTDPFSVSKAMPLGREIAKEYKDALAEYFPEAFADTYLCATAQLMGVRESRRIVGDYTLTAEDYTNRASFPDEISRNCYYIDVHMTPEEKAACPDRAAAQSRYGKGESHGIPYRCLTPKGIVNLLTAGRMISCDRRLLASVRVMPNCLTTGEAAGTAAAMAARSDCNTHAVDTDALRTRLRENGAYFK
ncbi:MAG: FAD-dependent oxidoreductase [Candidatus Howiella sp.]|jgi:hypothetical protein